jgi:Fur family ferric uptake transcriptional regulator
MSTRGQARGLGLAELTVGPLRTTRQRSAVLATLSEAEDFISALELHSRLRAAGHSIGLSTVYRAVHVLAAADDIDMIFMTDGTARYRRCAPSRNGYHHHLVCRRCGRTAEVSDPCLERRVAKMGREHGFSDVSHPLEIFGLCARCST